MKKFLTVLLALSVVFTYTVGTAFAVTPSTGAEQTSFNSLVDKAAEKAKSDFTTTYNSVYGDLAKADIDSSGITASKEAWQAGAAAYKADYAKKLDARAREMKEQYKTDKDPYDSANTIDEVIKLFSEAKKDSDDSNNADVDPHQFTTDPVVEVGTVADFATALKGNDITKVAAAKAQFDTIKNDAVSVLSNIDLSEYSTTIQKIDLSNAQDGSDVRETSYRTLASEFVQKQIAAVKAVVLDDGDDTVTKIADKAVTAGKDPLAIGTIGNTTADGDANTIMGYVHYDASTYAYTLSEAAKEAAIEGTGKLKNSFEEETGALTLDAAKKTALAKMNTNVSTYLTTNSANAAALAAAKKLVAAYTTVMTYYIENATTTADVAEEKIKAVDNAGAKWAENVAAIEELESYAAKCKAETDDFGNILRDADKVNDKVKEEKDAAYVNTGAEYKNLAAAKAFIKDNCYITTGKTAYAVGVKKAEIEAAREAKLQTSGVDNYYAPEAEKVNAVYDAMLAKVDAAKTDKEIDKIIVATEETNAGVDRIPTKDQVKATINSFDTFAANMTKLNEYKRYLNANNDQYTDAWIDFSAYDNAFFQDFYAKQGVRVKGDITSTVYAAAQAVLDKVKSDGQLNAEKLAVEKMIAALPSTITVADAAAVEAAWKAANDYGENAGAPVLSNADKLDSSIDKLFADELKQVRLMRLALPANLTVADKDAVKAYGDALKALDAKIGKNLIFEGKNIDTETQAYRTILKTIRDLEKKAVEAAINALPLNIKSGDKAAIEAARKLYDAYVAEYTVFADGDAFAVENKAPVGVVLQTKYDAASEIANANELKNAEFDLKEAQLKEVESLKIKASSSAKKGSITVKWSVTGNAAVADGYQVYKSTKAQSGYKFMGKTKKTMMTNKKNLKKGKRYFYKVRAYVEIDGTRYYSDWSNKANRFAK